MSFKVLNLYYQYANCISETNIFYNKSLITRNFSPEEASNLQLLSISLPISFPDSNEPDFFTLIKNVLNFINSYSAQFSQTEFDNIDFELAQIIIIFLFLLIIILEQNYKELTTIYEQNLSFTQVEFILRGRPLLFEISDDNNKKLKSLNEANDIDKEAILNKLNEIESISSNENYQAILKKALDM